MLTVNLDEDKEIGLDLCGRSYHNLIISRYGLRLAIKVRVDCQLKTLTIVEDEDASCHKIKHNGMELEVKVRSVK